MKIICIGRNYSDHAKELNNELPKEPLFFLKPDSSILPNRTAFYIPEFTNDVHYELELVYRICKVGKHIEEEFAHRYYSEIGLGIDFTARDIQSEVKKKGHPWERAKAFDGSAVVSRHFFPKTEFENLNNIEFHLQMNEQTVQSGNSSDMIFNIDKIISHVSKYMTLKIGDLIFTGTPAGVGKVQDGDILVGFLKKSEMFKVKIK
jgi:2-keto-4-pentenoate hydratase/2-oxohepta-3-ene-1,7-dioic acid hydratase in catechol pathway